MGSRWFKSTGLCSRCGRSGLQISGRHTFGMSDNEGDQSFVVIEMHDGLIPPSDGEDGKPLLVCPFCFLAMMAEALSMLSSLMGCKVGYCNADKPTSEEGGGRTHERPVALEPIEDE